MTAFTGVFPVHDLVFKIGIKGRASGQQDMKEIAEIENVGIKIDNKSEEWTTLTDRGWSKNLTTSKSLTLSLKGKRSIGDEGNDYIAAAAWKNGLDCNSKALILFPDGSKLEFDCTINVTNLLGDDSAKVAPLEFELKANGKPVFTTADELLLHERKGKEK